MNFTAMEHIFLSPHFDDAVGSCGGFMSALVWRGECVTVHTIFGGEPRVGLSELARRLHEIWSPQQQPVVQLREMEDKCACQILGCQRRVSLFSEGLYRCTLAGTPLYPTLQSLLSPSASDDEPLVEEILGELLALYEPARTRFIAPMGFGSHVDHVLVFRAARLLEASGYAVRHYSDFSYDPLKSPHVQGLRLRRYEEAFDLDTFDTKLKAFLCYASQVKTLFGHREGALDYFRKVNTASAEGRFAEALFEVLPT